MPIKDDDDKDEYSSSEFNLIHEINMTEYEILKLAMQQAGGDKKLAAKNLGISCELLIKRLTQAGLEG